MPLKTDKNPKKSEQTPEKYENWAKTLLLPLTNEFESRIVNGGGFV
jgi:hypothetical protein